MAARASRQAERRLQHRDIHLNPFRLQRLLHHTAQLSHLLFQRPGCWRRGGFGGSGRCARSRLRPRAKQCWWLRLFQHAFQRLQRRATGTAFDPAKHLPPLESTSACYRWRRAGTSLPARTKFLAGLTLELNLWMLMCVSLCWLCVCWFGSVRFGAG